MTRTNITVPRKRAQDFRYSIFDSGAYGDGATFTTNAAYSTAMEAGFTLLIRNRFPRLTTEHTVSGRLFAFKDFGTAGLDRNFELRGDTTSGLLVARICSGSGFHEITSTTILDKNNWGVIGLIYKPGERLAVVVNENIESEATPTVALSMNNGLGHLGGLADALTVSGAMQWCEAITVNADLTAAEISDYNYTGTIPTRVTKIQHLLPNEAGIISGTTIVDVTGNGYNATLEGNAVYSFDVPTQRRKVIEENSVSLKFKANESVEIKSSFDLSSGDWTIYQSFNMGKYDLNTMMTTLDGTGTGRIVLNYHSGTDMLTGFLGGVATNFDRTLIIEKWYRIAMSYNSTTNMIYGYIDGTLTSATHTTPESADGGFYLGMTKGAFNGMDGLIGGPVALYNVKHTHAQIRCEHFDKVRPADNRVWYLPLNEGTGNPLDTSGNGVLTTKAAGVDWVTTGGQSKIRTIIPTPRTNC